MILPKNGTAPSVKEAEGKEPKGRTPDGDTASRSRTSSRTATTAAEERVQGAGGAGGPHGPEDAERAGQRVWRTSRADRAVETPPPGRQAGVFASGAPGRREREQEPLVEHRYQEIGPLLASRRWRWTGCEKRASPA